MCNEKPIHKTPSEKSLILKKVTEVLEQEPRVVFAYAYGSFIESRPFHDIDIGVYLKEEDSTDVVLDLTDRLESALQESGFWIPVDMRSLNHAPLGFRYHVFSGQLLLSRDEAFRVGEVVYTISRYLDIKPLYKKALKEAMGSWSSIIH